MNESQEVLNRYIDAPIETAVGFIIVLLVLVIPMELMRRWFKNRTGMIYRSTRFWLLVGEIILGLALPIGAFDTLTHNYFYWNDNQAKIVSDIKNHLANNNIELALKESSNWKGRGNDEIDSLFVIASQKMDVLTAQRAEQKKIDDAKRLAEIDELIPNRDTPLILKKLYEERYGITGSQEDKAQMDKYNAILEEEYQKDLAEQKIKENAKNLAWYQFTKGLEKHALVPGSYDETGHSTSFINNDENILVVIDYTAKNAFGVTLKQRSGAIFSKDGEEFIRLATDDEIAHVYIYH